MLILCFVWKLGKLLGERSLLGTPATACLHQLFLEKIHGSHVLISPSMISCVAAVTVCNQLAFKTSLIPANRPPRRFVILIVCLQSVIPIPGEPCAEPCDSTRSAVVFFSWVM